LSSFANGNSAHLNVVTIAETTELLLSCGVPDIEADGAEVGVEGERVDLDTESGCARVAKGQRLQVAE
jgi:hypothetical protein